MVLLNSCCNLNNNSTKPYTSQSNIEYKIFYAAIGKYS